MTRVQWVLVSALAVVFAFALGFGWQYGRAASAQDELRQARQELTFKRLEATLAAAAIQAQHGSYETARTLASDFYGGLQRHIGAAPADARPELEDILARRDDVITILSREQPQGPEVLAGLAARFRGLLGGDIGVAPPPVPR
jgi:hypothetical protein